jgi:hypothetical protein
VAKRMLDGMAVWTPDEDTVTFVDEQVGIPIDEVLTSEEEPETAEVTSPEEYQAALIYFESAQKLALLPHTDGYPELIRVLQENAEAHAAAERQYHGTDERKIKHLRLARIRADYALEFVSNTVVDSVSVPRPVFNRQ